MQVTKLARSFDVPLQWGSRKRQRVPKVANGNIEGVAPAGALKNAMKIGDTCVVNGMTQDSKSMVDSTKPFFPDSKQRFSDITSERFEVDKFDVLAENPPNCNPARGTDEEIHQILPKFLISLSRKEKEEDFLIIKGSRLPPRPKKRAKHIQRLLHGITPGTWLCRLSLDRYEVCEKGKSRKQRSQGLKAMNSIDSDSE